MPEHDFTIATLYPSIKDSGKFKYKLPNNVIGVEENFLDDMGQDTGGFKKKFDISKGDMEEIAVLLECGDVNWEILIKFFDKNKGKNAQDFLMSKIFYDAIIGAYSKSYSHAALSDFFWTIRSMILPLVGLLRIDMPKAYIYHTVSAGYAGIMAVLGKKQHKSNMIITEHGIYTREREEEIIGASWVPVHFKDLWIKYFHNLSHCSYTYADRAITLFEDARIIQRELGCDKAKQMVIENGVNVKAFLSLKRKEYGKNGLNIGAIVRVVPIKDILTMIQAFNLVSEAYPNAQFYIMGPNDESVEYFEECLSITRIMGLEDVVSFTGRIDIKEYMPLMDVMVLSSISEGQPLSILESLAAGIPNVATNVGSCKEILYGKKGDELGQAGIVVPIMDYKQLAKGIIKILKSKKTHDSMALAGEERVKKIYTKERFINSYKELYLNFK